VPPAIAHDFAGGVTKVVETQTAGLGQGHSGSRISRGNMRHDTFFGRHSYRL
jgi:hypothetical protein